MAAERDQFGHYQIIRKLSFGGMGNVFLAQAIGDRRAPLVAIKRLHAHIAGDEKAQHMFAHEVEILEQLDHPNVDRLIDHGVVDGEPFLATPFLEGATLGELLTRMAKFGGKPPVEVAASIILQVLDGLRYVHELKDHAGNPRHIIHRDVTPQNIFITLEGQVKLIDFGVARANELTRLTRAGEAVGKYAYMSPEQVQEKEIDLRSDLFAVGIVAWETFAGARLFARENVAATIGAIGNCEISPLIKKNRELGAAVIAVVERALEREPEDRFSSAEEMRSALERCFNPRRIAAGSKHLTELARTLFPDRAITVEHERVTDENIAVEDSTDVGPEAVDTGGYERVADSVLARLHALHAPELPETMVVGDSAIITVRPSSSGWRTMPDMVLFDETLKLPEEDPANNPPTPIVFRPERPERHARRERRERRGKETLIALVIAALAVVLLLAAIALRHQLRPTRVLIPAQNGTTSR